MPRIVGKVEDLFTLADTIEASVTKAGAKAEKIKQSLLSKAFRGELVEQDPNDPPASALLEQIKLEKEKMKVGARAPRKRTAASAGR